MNEETSTSPRLIGVFDRAQGLPAGEERERFLAEACAGDEQLRAEVGELLRADSDADSFLKAATADVAGAEVTVGRVPSEQPGERIGSYKLLEKIGEGGFGMVWVAEQERPLRRKVALKVLKPGMDSRQVLARFEAERQALAIMDHPNIATVHDGGVTPNGRPFFVMELVKGVPITEFCDQRQLTPRARLELFLQVCHAVQHAHQKGIIHRDLKPSNILVAMHDTTPAVKVIDFGIAKALGQELTERTMFTGFAQFLGTPLYMSPEQAGQSSIDVDTRSDIYSLGVLLYELLTGTTPFDRARFKQAAEDEIRRIIREEEPPRPSTRLSESKDSLPSISAQRHTEPAKLTKLVRGELDWIVMKAIEKDRSRRYETANGFAMDVQRYLANEPVTACPPTTVYRLRKFVKRHKGGVAIAALVMLFLVLVGSGIGWAVRERSARQSRVTGQVELVLAEVDQFLRGQQWPEALLAARRAGAVVAGGEADAATEQRVRELLKDLEFIDRLEQIRMKRSAWIDGKFDVAGPNLEYEQSFRDYGVDAAGLPVETAIERLKARQPFAMPLAAALDEWADTHWGLKNDAPGAKRLLAIARGIDPEPLRDKVRSTWGKTPSEVGDELQRIAGTIDIRAQHPATIGLLVGKLNQVKRQDSALRLLRDAQSAYPGDFRLNFELAHQLAEKSDYEGAVRFYTAAVAIRPHAVAARNNLGIALSNQEMLDEAIACYRKAVEIDPNFAVAYCNLGGALGKQGKLDEALACCRKAIKLTPNDAHAYNSLGVRYDDLKDYEGAAASFRKAIELNPKDARTYDNLGLALHSRKKLDEAIAAYRKAIELDPDTARFHNNLGLVLRDQKKLDEAVAASRKAIELDPKDTEAYINLGNTLKDQKKSKEAIAAFERAIGIDPKCANAYTNLGVVLADQNKFDEAIAAHRKAIEVDPKFAVAYANLGTAFGKQGKLDEAAAALRKAIGIDPKIAKAYNNLATVLKDQGKLDEALAAYRKAIELDSADTGTYNGLGVALMEQGKLDEAIAAYRKAIELDPDFGFAYNNLGNALEKQGKLDEAVAAYRKAIELDPESAVVYRNLGKVFALQHKLDEAIAAYRKAIELDSKDTGAYINLGNALVEQGKLDEAVAAYRKAIELHPEIAGVYRNLGQVFALQHKLDEAIAAYRKAIELDPRDAGAYNNLGTVLKDQGKLDEAIAALRKAIELDPKLSHVSSNLGIVLGQQKKLDEAATALRKAVELHPESASAHNNLGALLCDGLLDYEGAAASFRKAIELDPKNTSAHSNLGNALSHQGKVPEAIASYKKALAIDPQSAYAHLAFAWLLATASDSKFRDPGQAVTHARKGVELDPSNPDYSHALGIACYRTGDWKAAIAGFEKARELYKSDDRTDWFFLAMAHWQSGNKADARKWYDQSVEYMKKKGRTHEELSRIREEAAALLGVNDDKPQ